MPGACQSLSNSTINYRRLAVESQDWDWIFFSLVSQPSPFRDTYLGDISYIVGN